MPKAGRYDYPSRELDLCIDHLRKANESTKEVVFKREDFANALKQKTSGGGFNVLVGSMSTYKLVETGSGEIRYTELAKEILHGRPHEIEKAKEKAVRNVILFADIYDKFGANPTEDQLYNFLKIKANVDVSEANSLALEIGKLFNKVAKYLKPVDQSETGDGGENKEMLGQEVTQSGILTETYKLGEGTEIKLPKDNATVAWDKAKRALDIILGVDQNDSNSAKRSKESEHTLE